MSARTAFNVRVCYEVWDEESVEMGETDVRGVEYEIYGVPLSVIVSVARDYQILARDTRTDVTAWWQSYPERDYHTGEEITYSMHLTYNGKRLSDRNFLRVNRAIAKCA